MNAMPENPLPPDAATLSRWTQADFTRHLAAIYEHSPWIAERAWLARPFASRQEIADAMEAVLRRSGVAAQLDLILAHPELSGKAGIRTDLTADSSREQRGAGLDQCSPEEYERLHHLNSAYRARHGFPFILAVAGRNRTEILEALQTRVDTPTDVEFRTALDQIVRIAAFRLRLAIADDAPAHDGRPG